MEGTVISGDPGTSWQGASLDSRGLSGGELFFALRGERADGHDFVADAFERGAAAAVVERPAPAPGGAALIRVEDGFAALHALTRAVRAELGCRVVAITGSAGKTTTKELLAAMLAPCFRVARSPGNLNNLYGFPVSLLAVPDDAEWMVAEMGMSTPGELAAISLLGRPEVAVFTNVRPVHLEFFGSLRAITIAKAELLDGLAPAGRVVANRDDPEVRWLVGERAGDRHVLWYGRAAEAEVRAVDIEPRGAGEPGSRFRLLTPAGEAPVELPLLGLHNVENCLAAAAAAHLIGVPPQTIAAAAAGAAPAAMRGVVHALPAGGALVDDSYNANPDAVTGALASVAALAGSRRRWAVLGDMLELGAAGPAYHRRSGAEAARLGFSPVLGVGELARETAAAAAAAGAESGWFPNAAAAVAAVAQELRPGDVVLVKGSRGVALETIVRALLAAAEGA